MRHIGVANVTDITSNAISFEAEHLARNYSPLPVVLSDGEGAWVTDIEGNRYLDCLAAYSAVNFGHRNPALIEAAITQLGRLTLSSRAFHAEPLGDFVAALADLTGKECVLPMNTGAEAVESGLKVARRWAYEVKGVPAGQAEVIVAAGNFHGRTTTIVSFSDDPDARAGYGPYTPGFRVVRYGEIADLERAITPNTAAILLEPIQGEAGIIIPPDGYLQAVSRLAKEHNFLFIADEIQSGLGRTGATFECENAGVVPDMYLLGKALGGGIVPVSAVVANWDILGVLTPGSHGSTFGGNPVAAAVGMAVVRLLKTGVPQRLARERGAQLAAGLGELVGHGIERVRVRGLWAGLDIDPKIGSGRDLALSLMRHGVLAKDTHGQTLRLAPPLVISEAEVDQLLAALKGSLTPA